MSNLGGQRRVSVLVICDYYLPGFKAGGPVRSVSNIISWLSPRIKFAVFTRDRDVGDSLPYANVLSNRWNETFPASIFYAAPCIFHCKALRRVVKEVSPTVVYINSFFSGVTFCYLLLRKCRLIQRSLVVLAPRGELSAGALKLKSLKKQVFILFAVRLCGLYQSLRWQASSPLEAAEVQTLLRSKVDVRIAPNLPPRVADWNKLKSTPLKEPGHVRLVFCSRVSRKKNLDFVIPLLGELGGTVELDVYGPIGELDYWSECRKLIGRLPENVVVTHRGDVTHEMVAHTLSAYHFFILPTLGENFGHAILEGLCSGCPVMISDRTPWNSVAGKGSGWILSLEDQSAWRDALKDALAMDETRYRLMSVNARKYGAEYVETPAVEATACLFECG